MDRYYFDCTVIGGGVSGLSCARAIAQRGLSVALIEKEAALCCHTSSRNSEVLHSGIYYANSPLKHALCLDGQPKLYEYLEERNIDYNRSGKFVFSNKFSDYSQLDKLADHARKFGVKVTRQSPKNGWPDIFSKAPSNWYFFPDTGIFNSHQYIESLELDLLNAGGVVSLNSRVTRIEPSENKIELICDIEHTKYVLESKIIINATGQDALDTVKKLNTKKYQDYENHFVKGHYFSYSSNTRVEHLYYPMPSQLGLGVHLTIDLNNGLRFGPDTCVVTEREDYSLSIPRKEFLNQICENFDGVDNEKVFFSYSGIRPKLNISGEISADFIFELDCERKVISLLNIESPGLTASLALANKIAKLAMDCL